MTKNPGPDPTRKALAPEASLPASGENLRMASERLELALRAAKLGVWEYESASGRVTWDDRMLEIYGVARESFRGTYEDWEARLHPEDRERAVAEVAAIHQAGNYVQEFRVVGDDGSVRHVRSAAMVTRDEGGQALHVIGTCCDITGEKLAEQALLKERTFTRALLDTMSEGVMACDEQGAVVMTNRALRSWHEMEREGQYPPLGQLAQYHDLYEADGTSPVDSESVPLARAFEGESFQDAELTVRAPGRPARHLMVNGSPIAGEDGLRLGAMVVAHDVTRQRRTDEAMRKISVAVLQSPVMIVITDARGAVEFVNPKFSEVTGYAPMEILGQNPRILKSGDHPPRAYEELWATILGGEIWKGEFHNRKKSGELYWETATIAPIKDPLGRITNFVAIKEDITRFKRNEQARQESEARFQELFETSKDGLVAVDPEGCYLDCNRAFLDLLGLETRDELLFRSYEAFTPAEYLNRQRTLIAECRQLVPGGCVEMEKEYLRKDGTRVPVELRVWTRRDPDGRPVGLWVIVRDITERLQAQRQLRQMNEELEERIRRRTALLEQANAELDAFSYSVSHDLRAPLRGIDGFSQALLEECGDQVGEQARHYLQRVRAGTQRMGQLIDDLLKLSRASRGALARRSLDLGALAQVLMAELRLRDPDRPLEFRVDEGLTAQGDPGLVRSALLNLLDNAWKYTAKVPWARISFFQETLPDSTRAFCVQDNGAGFDMAYAGKLFTAFQRLHSPSDFEGSGIGLAIVQRIFRRHGGQVWAEGRVGEGARFYFTLPELP